MSSPSVEKKKNRWSRREIFLLKKKKLLRNDEVSKNLTNFPFRKAAKEIRRPQKRHHRSQVMNNFFRKKRMDWIMIPAGMTACLRVLDIAINKPFKDRLRSKINGWLRNGTERKKAWKLGEVRPGRDRDS